MTFLGELRPYQNQAKALILQRERALLALDLGTGKTIVSLAAIEELREEGKVECALLIMSSSLTVQWAERIGQFTDSSVIVVDASSSPKKRLSILEAALNQRPDYVVMGIRQAVSDMTFIRKLKPEFVLVDEVTSIKNFGSQQSKAIKKLDSRFKVGLTADPIENGKAEELYSIFQWIDPELFGHWSSFDEYYIIRSAGNFPVGYKNMDEMHALLMTACISKRRTDPDVAEFMPTVEEYNVYVEMDNDTAVLYRSIAREILQALFAAGPRAHAELSSYYAGRKGLDDSSDLGTIGSRILGATLLLDSPVLLRASGDSYNDPERAGGSRYASDLLRAGRVPSEGSYGAKLEACVELASEYLEEDPRHKVIIFTKYRGMLPLLTQGLEQYGSVQFHGGLNGTQRGESIQRFTDDAEVRLFISSDAGGYGVDLFAASHLINYDLPNSSGAAKQRNGRHVRASSIFRRVFIDNLIMRDSIEEYQLSRLSYKNEVARAAMTGQMSDPTGTVSNEGKSLTKFLETYLKDI